jgi:hypothetical protein
MKDEDAESYSSQQALRDATLRLPAGRIGLLGPNGVAPRLRRQGSEARGPAT